jgi:hypothetical protein
VTGNAQASVALTGGGDGTTSVYNSGSTTVDVAGAAGALSGQTVAGSHLPDQLDSTTASSGAATAQGLSSLNVVTNSAFAAVQVGGANEGTVSITSSHQATIVDTGAATAVSGAANALPAAASAGVTSASGLSGTPLPSRSDSVQSVGLTGQTTIMSTAQATVAVSSASATPGTADSPVGTPVPSPVGTPIVIAQSNGVGVGSIGMAGAQSAPVCGGPGCATVGTSPAAAGLPLSGTSAAPAGAGATNAASGSAGAQGLIAENVVQTDASVVVKIGGENHGTIRIVIDTVTQIVNYGLAVAVSGVGSAVGGQTRPVLAPSAATAGAPAAALSGDADAVGGLVQNRVDMGTNASVRVEGDNHIPIRIDVEAIALLVNLGAAVAETGDASAAGGVAALSSAGTPVAAPAPTADVPVVQAASTEESTTDATGGASAVTGAARALGLQVQNVVNLWAQVFVEITGNNYADIDIYVHLGTEIENDGRALASTGSAEASRTVADAALVGADETGSDTTEGRTAGPNSAAISGDTAAVGNIAVVAAVSNQNASANGSGSSSAGTAILDLTDPTDEALAEVREIVNQLPGALEASAPATTAPAAPDGAGTFSQSGSAASLGMSSSTVMINGQIAVCSSPGTECTAANQGELAHFSAGQASSESGFAGADATPTPTPTPERLPSGQGGLSPTAVASPAGRGPQATVTPEPGADRNGPVSAPSGDPVGSPRDPGAGGPAPGGPPRGGAPGGAGPLPDGQGDSGNGGSRRLDASESDSFRIRGGLVDPRLISRWPTLGLPPIPNQKSRRPAPQIDRKIVPPTPVPVVAPTPTPVPAPEPMLRTEVRPRMVWPELGVPPIPVQVVQVIDAPVVEPVPAATPVPSIRAPGPTGVTPIPAETFGLIGLIGLAGIAAANQRSRVWLVRRAARVMALLTISVTGAGR